MLKKLNYILDRRQKVHLFFLLVAFIIGSFLELLGVSAILPLVNVIMDPSVLETNSTYALLARLLQNLIDNGFAYGKPQGHVWVTLGTEGDRAVLQVRDDGIGIPQDQQEKIWQRFYQVDPARREGGGAGLGLSMVKKIAQLHGGRITLDSTPGQGSTFTLSLPLEKELFAP